jgi:hypothetical protein
MPFGDSEEDPLDNRIKEVRTLVPCLRNAVCTCCSPPPFSHGSVASLWPLPLYERLSVLVCLCVYAGIGGWEWFPSSSGPS